MSYVILTSLFYVAGFIWLFTRKDWEVESRACGFMIHGLLLPLLLFMLGFVVIPLTGGLYEGYSTGQRIGYFTKISKKGVCWKTWEMKIQVGTGEMAALQNPHPFSTVDDALAREIQENLGRKARVHYSEWLLMPFWKGNSGYTITKIKWLDKKGGGDGKSGK